MKELTLEDARRALTYNPATGELRWTAEERPRRKSDIAGTIAANGYIVIRLAGKLHRAHRLGWLLHYGTWPTHSIDHINGDRADNRIANLRDVPHLANMKNRAGTRMLVGAVPNGDGTWRSAVHRYGRADDLGATFQTPAEANAAWLEAKARVKNPKEPRPQVRPRPGSVNSGRPG